MTTPSFPSGVSKTGSVEPSPKPQTSRSGSGRHHFAVFAEIGSVWREKKNTTVECATIALDNTNNKIDFIVTRRAGKLVHGRAGNIDAAFPVAPKVFPAFVCARTNHCAEVESAGIARDEGFGEKARVGRLAELPRGPVCGLS